MPSKKPRSPKDVSIVFFGNERLCTGLETSSTPTLKALIEVGYEVKAVVTNQAENQSRKMRELEVEVLAKKHNIPVFFPKNPIDIIDVLAKFSADIGVLAAYGKIVPQKVIDIFPYKIINVHPSLLPKFRGPTPIEQAILSGEEKTGVSIMQLVSKMDAGPVFVQKSIRLDGLETKFDLADKLDALGAELITEILPDILRGTLKPQQQDESEVSFCSLIEKSDGLIDPAKTAIELERETRAYLGWPKSYFEQAGQRFIVTQAKASTEKSELGKLSVSDKKLYYGCRDGSLEILEIQPTGKPKMNASAFINGYKQILI